MVTTKRKKHKAVNDKTWRTYRILKIMHGFRACKHSVYFSLNPKFTTMFVKNFQIYDVQIFKNAIVSPK